MILNLSVVNLTKPALQSILGVLGGTAVDQADSVLLSKDQAKGLLFLVSQEFSDFGGAEVESKTQFAQELQEHIGSGDRPFSINLDAGERMFIALGILSFMGFLEPLVEKTGLKA